MLGKVLIVDDDKEVLELNGKFLSSQGFSVRALSNSLNALKACREFEPDCIVLDVMMPGLDGFGVFRQLREITNVPIIFLTGRASEDDKINGLLLGADDYMTKPYSIKELAARILTNIRRHKAVKEAGAASIEPSAATVMTFPNFTINFVEHKLYTGDTEIVVTNREFDLIALLATRPGEPFNYEEISEKFWGNYSDVERRSLMVNVSRLRKKLEEYPGCENIIESVWGKGYRLGV